MNIDPVKWNKRASLAYAIGIWTMFGCYGYYRFTHKDDPPVEMPVEEEDNRPNVKKYETAHSKTIIVYRENFVPYSTRLLHFFRNTSESSPDSQNQEEQNK